MARNDFKVISPASQLLSVKWLVAAGATGTTGMYRGEPTIMSSSTGTTDGLVKIAGDGDPTNAANHRFAGIAKSNSTQTASAAGVVWTYFPFPGVIYEGKPKTAGSCNTDAKIDALKGARIILDLTSTAWRVDTGATEAAANGVIIIGGDPKADTCYFVVSSAVTVMADNA